MQKVINVLALLSFVGTSAIIAGGGYVYLNKDSIIANVKSRMTEAIGEAITDSLPIALDAELPEALPQTTGGVLPF